METGLKVGEFYNVRIGGMTGIDRLRFEGEAKNGHGEHLLVFKHIVEPHGDLYYGAKWEIKGDTTQAPKLELVASHVSSTNAGELRPINVPTKERFIFIK